MAIHGPSKSGKTYTALCLACMLAKDKPPVVIDAEAGRSRQYAGLTAKCEGADGLVLAFDVGKLSSHSPQNYQTAIQCAADAGYGVLVVDGISQAYETLLEDVERLTSRKYHGNSFRAWGEAGPIWKRMIANIIDYPGHVIVTMRTKTKYEVEMVNGKARPKKVGTAPIVRDGTEYEFDHLLAMDAATGTLDSRSAAMDGRGQKIYEKPGRKLLADIMGE
jgi:hypothetical protein